MEASVGRRLFVGAAPELARVILARSTRGQAHEPSVFWVKPSDLVVAMIGAAVAAK